MKGQERIAIYGKGGVGKSVIATSLSVCFAQQGRKVLHVGCDPKQDSAVRLMAGGNRVRSVLEVLGDDPNVISTEAIINHGRLGIDCCESGGPQPGLGCGGRGVARTLEFLDETDVLTSGAYDVVIFDVLGDVVCGGFAAPLRKRFAEKVLIVTSEEPMALYAANNISRAISIYHENGVVLGGLIINQRSPDVDRQRLEDFAKALSTQVLAYIPREDMIMQAERQRSTVIEFAPDSEVTSAFRDLAKTISYMDAGTKQLPTPMSDETFYEFMGSW